MRPTDEAIEAARAAILKAMAERNCIIAGVPFNENNIDEFDSGEAIEHAKAALTAAYAAQFQSEDYAGLIEELREDLLQFDLKDTAYENTAKEAANAIELLLAKLNNKPKPSDDYAVLVERLRKNSVWGEVIEELAMVRAERDALAARLAPVDDEALVEIVGRTLRAEVFDPDVLKVYGDLWAYDEQRKILKQARAAIAAIRPHIEAAERERCAKIAEARLRTVIDLPDGYINGWEQCQRSTAAAIRRSGK